MGTVWVPEKSGKRPFEWVKEFGWTKQRKAHGGATNGGSAKESPRRCGNGGSAKGNPRRCGKWWVSQGKSMAVQQMVVQVRNAHGGAANGGAGKECPRGAANGGAAKECPRRCSKWWCR
ncbi:hypothetical protein [Bacillus sp. REN3]|uniref:hypothetical protein n=1 Tax=Bacillus sp. REN3 TaxID=2802440 RepID=UPI001AED87AF|nr:hypothetical protein [Bacillus sp. REN3]